MESSSSEAQSLGVQYRTQRFEGAAEEARKLRQHLDILKEEHVKVQAELAAVQRRCDIALASTELQTPGGGGAGEDSFVHRLTRIVTALFEKDLYSDITIHLDGHQLRAHRFVLAARSDDWGVSDLSSVDKLEFPGISYNIGYTVLKWVYTDQIDAKLGDSFLLDMMKAAKKFHLNALFIRCEHLLISGLDIRNCIPVYQAAVEIEAENLRDKCSQLISTRWEDFTSKDFESMSAQLLYKMLRGKVSFPLHEAIRLRREDVVFLYLIEFDAELSSKLNEMDEKGDLPLSLALWMEQEPIAKTLVSHRANIDGMDSEGRSLLFNAVGRGNAFACRFLLENGANVALVHEKTGKTPLHVLCELEGGDAVGGTSGVSPTAGDLQSIADSLFAKGPSLNRVDLKGSNVFFRTALHYSVLSENEVLLRRLLQNGEVDLNVIDVEEETPLSIALSRQTTQSLNIAWSLLQKGADVDRLRPSTGDSLLHENVSAQNVDSVKFLLENKAKINVQNSQGLTPLHLACEVGLVDVARSLLDGGADPNLQTRPGGHPGCQTPLHVAVSNGFTDIISEILDCGKRANGVGADLTMADEEGETPLGFALWRGLYEIAERLISGGGSVNAVYADGNSLLLRAIQSKDEEAALFLLKKGANAGSKTKNGEHSLQVAVKARLAAVARALCRAGADMNVRDEEGVPPLWVALAAEDEETASALVEHGCDTDSWGPGPSGSEQTLLHRAIDDNNEKAACFLVRSFANVNAIRRVGPTGEGEEEAREKQTPLHMCATWGLLTTVGALLEHGANVNAIDVEGKTPVHVAVSNHHADILKLLLRSPDVGLTIKDRRGMTPFATAMQVRNNFGAKAILEREPRVASQVDSKGFNFLHTAAKNGDLESVLFLLSVKMDVTMPTQDAARLTPLHLTAEEGSEIILRNLLLAGANINALTGRSRTALHIAAENDNAKLCNILLENGIDYDALDSVQNNEFFMLE